MVSKKVTHCTTHKPILTFPRLKGEGERGAIKRERKRDRGQGQFVYVGGSMLKQKT
jgi:hypothetical protein